MGQVTEARCLRCGWAVTAQAVRCPECSADPRTGVARFSDPKLDRVRVCEGLPRRALALAIDLLVIASAATAIGFVVYIALLLVATTTAAGADVDYASFVLEPGASPITPVLAFFLGTGFAYVWVGHARWGRTLGKRLLDLRLVRTDGSPAGWGASLLRTALLVVDYLPVAFVLGAAAIALTPRHQRLGDLAARTVVVRVRLLAASRIASGEVRVVPWRGPGEAASAPPEASPAP